jgi:hypothetical protein
VRRPNASAAFTWIGGGTVTASAIGQAYNRAQEDRIMPVMMLMEWKGVTPEQYDQAREAVGWEREPAAGGLFHVAGFEGGALQVTDVWESPEHFQRFADERLMPGVKDLGLPGQPTVRFVPVHRIFTPAYTPK